MAEANNTIKIAALGDLLLTTRPNENKPDRDLEALSPEIKKLFSQSDIVLANLECTLSSPDKVSTEPRVFSSEEQIRSVKEAGINLVTLGNNHCFDGGEQGFVNLRNLLADLAINHFGAGQNLTEASTPALIEANGIKIAFLALVDETTGMHRFADEKSSGVAPFDLQHTCRQLVQLSRQVDHIIIVPHWGEERFRIPSPKQITQAKELIAAGATAIIGHHPHVLQGMKHYDNRPVIFSLGNFFANKVHWEDGDYLTWNRFERTSCILLLELSNKKIIGIEQIPVYDNGATIEIEKQGFGIKYIKRAKRLLNEVTDKKYRRERFRVLTLLPILNHLKWAELKKIRLGHFKKLFTLIQNRNH